MTVKAVSQNARGRPRAARSVFAPKPFSYVEAVRRRLNVTNEQMAAYIGVTFRTYQRRAKKGELEDAESAKVEMLASLLDLGKRVLGDEEAAREWLMSPITSLGGQVPIALLDTVRGYERVKNKLLQIEHGNY